MYLSRSSILLDSVSVAEWFPPTVIAGILPLRCQQMKFLPTVNDVTHYVHSVKGRARLQSCNRKMIYSHDVLLTFKK